MKKMIKALSTCILLSMAAIGYGQSPVDAIIDEGATGTASATVFINEGTSNVNITDLSWRLDAGVSTGTVDFRIGDNRYNVSSATSASSTQLWFANTGTTVAVDSFVIIYDVSAGDYFLRKAVAATTTSITLNVSLSPAITTSDLVWNTRGTISKAVANTVSTSTAYNIWLPANVPTAITLDGNTTACRISVSGVRSNYR